MELVPLSLECILKTVCQNFDANPAANQILDRLPVDLPLVLADEGVLNSILNHLLDNALKYAPGSHVVVEEVLQGNKVRVQVKDKGPGIPEAKRSLLFRRFQRLDAKDSQSVYGYGFGLYLSRLMLRAMHSNLAFEAPAEGGACFYFDLKVAE